MGTVLYETDKQIFIHASIDEISPDWHLEAKYDMIWKYPGDLGRYHKDIIAGHIFARLMREQYYERLNNSAKDFVMPEDEIVHNDAIFWDGENHYYIDGKTPSSLVVNILVYDTETEKYYDGYTKEEIL